MRYDVTFIILSRDGSFTAELRAQLLKLDGVKIAAEIEEPVLLAQAVQHFPADILLVDLDPSPETILPIVSEVAHVQYSAPIVLFAASDSTEGSLILKAMRMGVKEFLPKPIDAKALTEAIERVTADRVQRATQGKLITVVGTSGGVGSTLISVNLAVELAALAEGQVTVVDLDYRLGQVATLLDLEPNYTFADLCGSSEELDPHLIGRALTKHSTGVQVLSRPARLNEADTITTAGCMGVVSSLIRLNEYVVADGPAPLDVGSKSILALSDVTLLVVQQLVPCVRNALRILDYMRDGGFNLDRVKLICNRVEQASGHLSVEDVTKTLGLDPFACIPGDWEASNRAISLGEPLLTYSPKSKLRVAIGEIAQRLHVPASETDKKDTRKPGLISRIFANG